MGRQDGIAPAPDAPMQRKPFYRQLYVQVLTAIVLGAIVGHLFPEFGASLKPLGDGFIKLVKMIIAPVIFLTVATGIAGMRDMSKVGSVAGKAFVYFLFFSTLALIIGLVVGNVVRPGAGLAIDPATLDAAAVANFTETAKEQSITGFLLDIIPETLFSAMTEGKILQVLLVAILAGVAMAMTRPHSDLVLDVLGSLSEIVFKLVHMLMKLAPIGAFGAIAFTIGEFGIGSLANLAALIATFYLTSLLFVLVVLGLVGYFAGFSIFSLIRYLREELLLVLGTSSSEAALPSLMEKMEIAGCRKTVVGLVVPTGYSFNLDGTNIYMTLAALFIAQAVGIELSWGEQFALVLVAMISSKGAAGV
ncbi:MAG TPA: C4-dicarboxylate transporter DctA, partial [Erythrobacter sp.]|nr:C4-dicarboxylate transporter DctA [Erythrobacter sp.]